MFVIFLLALFILQPLVANANSDELLRGEQIFRLELGKSRIITAWGSKGETLPILNEKDYPMLVQTQVSVDGEISGDGIARFSATPPLFRLDGQQRAKVRIAYTGGKLPDDKESLYWVCVKGIPPTNNESWADGKYPSSTAINVQMIVSKCIKLLVRPKGLVSQNALAMAEKLKWQLNKQELTATNPTPFYINLSALTIGGKVVDQVTHIAPFSSHTFAVPTGASGEVQWRALSDLGGEGPLLRAALP